MTRRTSTRALAREIYCASTQAPPTPDPSPPLATLAGGGEISGAGAIHETNLTARVRALYEDSAVPVREIARLVGVTERTIYKYVEKHHWKRRYKCLPRDRAVRRADRGRRWQAAPGFAPAKGAGARFIRREDKGKPFARGLKALDPAGRARALRASDKAARLAHAAQAQAEAERATDALCRAFDMMRAANRQLADYAAERQARGAARPTRFGALRERALFMACDHATQNVEHTAAAWQQAELRARAAK
jgi:hypothetical protein